MSTTPFTRSLAGRLLMFGVVPSMMAIAAIVTLSGMDGYRNALKAEKEVLAADAEGAAAELGTRNQRWGYIASIIATNQTTGLFGKRKETSDHLKGMNALSDQNLSMFVVYEPNADGQDSAALKSADVPREAMDAAGRFAPVWYDEYIGGVRTGVVKLRAAAGMESMAFYLGPKNDFAKSGQALATITEPRAQDGIPFLTHSFPIIMDGKFVGVAGVDRSLAFISQLIGKVKARTSADVFVLSPEGTFIAATTDSAPQAAGAAALEMRRISDTSYAPSALRWLAEPKGEQPDAFEAHDPVLDEECLYAVKRTEVGGWTIVIRRPLSECMRLANASIVRNVALGLAGMVLVGALLYFVSRGITTRVRVAAASAERIARGDLTRPIPESTSADETGQLMRSMNSMDGNLNALVGNVKQAGIRLNSTATEIAATSKQQEASTAAFGAASNQIAAAVKEITATGRDLARTMDSVNRVGQEMAELAGAGQKGLQGMESVMQDLNSGTRSIADKLGAISDRSQKITSVITTIAKVADQTNILSINAAIEAERAGEVGAGFLVIAREIRRLADQSAAATLDIEQIVQQMQSAVSTGVMEMDRFSDQVRRGVRDVATAGMQLTEIITRVNTSTEAFRQVSESMQAQSEGVQQISEGMASLASNASQTVQSAHEFGRAAADLQTAIATLREAVARFNLRE
ncbi:MAG: methyl-accepting chemotaxis protein [Phycisphaerales bacterium]|nr:methyl-accepting chemotaxis protein [Phycisphaerales bacterium]